jgi:glycosyltransferase involved in cell wall biosynthesis
VGADGRRDRPPARAATGAGLSGTPEIRWRAPLFDVTGYATEARELVLGLAAAGARVQAVPVAWEQPRCPLDGETERRLVELVATRVGSDALRVEHLFPQRWEAGAAVGRTMFETDRIPAAWVAACNAVREVWVPSRFNVETFAASGVDPERLAVVPSPIDTRRWRPEGPRLELPGRRFTFLSIFDWSLRKGWDVLLRAYCAEFTKADDVVLLLKVHSSYGLTGADVRRELRSFVRAELPGSTSAAPAIAVLDRILPAVRMPALYRAADCFVLPTRGEGCGRPFLEATAVGVPVIATGWGGQTDFLHDDAALVEIQGLVPVAEAAAREAPGFRGHRWAEPSAEHLRVLMRQPYERPDEARIRAARAREHVIWSYDVPVVSEAALARLRELAG